MRKKLILGLALAAVLISAPFIWAQAGNVSASCWAGFCPAWQSNTDQAQRDMDRPEAPCQGAYRYGPTTPEPMGSPGF